MASNTSNAWGMAKQFGSQPKRTHEKQLKGVNTNYYVDTADYSDDERIGRGLTALGVSWGENALQHEKNLLTFAQATTDQVLMNATEEDKRKLSSAELLVKGGVFDPEDNPYNVAVLDSARGKQFMRQVKLEYDVYAEGQKLGKSPDEAIKTYEEFVQERLKDFDGAIDNKYAFNLGARDIHDSNVLEVAKDYSIKRKLQDKVDRRDELFTDVDAKLADVDILGEEDRKAAYNELASVWLKAEATSTSDPNEELAIRQGILERVANKGTEALNTFGEIIGADGVKIKDSISLKPYHEIAKAYDVANRVRRLNGYKEKAYASETLDIALDYIDKNIPDEKDRENVRKGLPSVFKQKGIAKTKERQAQTSKILQGAKVARSAAISKEYYQALKNGSEYIAGEDNIPTGYDSTWAKSFDLDADALGQGVLDEMYADVEKGDYSGVTAVLSTKIAGRNFKNYVDQNWDRDIRRMQATGQPPETISKLLDLYTAVPNSIRSVIGDDKTNQLLMLDTVLKTYPDNVSAAEAFSLANTQLQDKTIKETLEKDLLEVEVPSTFTPEVNYAFEGGVENKGFFGFFAGNMATSLDEPHNKNVTDRIDQLALNYHALGLDAVEAQRKAHEDVLNCYVAYGNSFIDKELIAPISTDPDRAGKFFGESAREIQNRIAQGRSLNYLSYDKEHDLLTYVWSNGEATPTRASAVVAQAGGRALLSQQGKYELWQWNKGGK